MATLLLKLGERSEVPQAAPLQLLTQVESVEWTPQALGTGGLARPDGHEADAESCVFPPEPATAASLR